MADVDWTVLFKAWLLRSRYLGVDQFYKSIAPHTRDDSESRFTSCTYKILANRESCWLDKVYHGDTFLEALYEAWIIIFKFLGGTPRTFVDRRVSTAEGKGGARSAARIRGINETYLSIRRGRVFALYIVSNFMYTASQNESTPGICWFLVKICPEFWHWLQLIMTHGCGDLTQCSRHRGRGLKWWSNLTMCLEDARYKATPVG